MKYETCTECAAAREAGELDEALHCSPCKGTGIVRNKAIYICNKCGGSMAPSEDTNDPHGLVEVSVSGGYHSFHLFDLTSYEFSLCEKCLRVLFGTFKVPPRVWDVAPGDGRGTYAEDAGHYLDRLRLKK